MATPRAVVLRTAGTNCDHETVYALEKAGFAAERVHLLEWMERPELLLDYQFLLLPGGFSYGDDIAAGKILANQLLFRLAEPLAAFLAAGRLVLGICNGFQVALKSGLLPWGRVDPARAQVDATLAWNDSGRFEDRWVHLKVSTNHCPMLPEGEVLAMPIAHGEGKFVPRDAAMVEELRRGDQVALTYCDAEGDPGGYPVNPNGSVADIAGICDPSGRVLGLMPHPERFAEITQHPRWTRGRLERADGMVLFERAMAHLR